MNDEYEIKKPVFESEPDFVNSIGTKFWKIKEFDLLISELGINISVCFSESAEEDDDQTWGYIIVDDDRREVLFDTLFKDEIEEILMHVMDNFED